MEQNTFAYPKVIQKEFENKGGLENLENRVDMTVSHAVRMIVNRDTGEKAYLGVLSPSKFKKGIKFYQALGGGAKLTPLGSRLLKCLSYEPAQIKIGTKEESDARFTIPAKYLPIALRIFEKFRSDIYEDSPEIEMIEELSDQDDLDNEFGPDKVKAPLSKNDIDKIQINKVDNIFQLVSNSSRIKGKDGKILKVMRIFPTYILTVDNDIYAKLKGSDYVKLLSQEEVSESKTENGDQVGDNIYPTHLADVEAGLDSHMTEEMRSELEKILLALESDPDNIVLLRDLYNLFK